MVSRIMKIPNTINTQAITVQIVEYKVKHYKVWFFEYRSKFLSRKNRFGKTKSLFFVD